MDFRKLRQALEQAKTAPALYDCVVNQPFQQQLAAAYLFLGFMVLFLVPPGKKFIKLAATTDNDYYRQSVSGYSFTPSKFQLSLTKDTDNDIVKAVLTGEPQTTSDWRKLRRRWADPEQTSLNQASSGIAWSVMCPLDVPAGGVLMFSFYQFDGSPGEQQQQFMKQYCDLVSEYLRGL